MRKNLDRLAAETAQNMVANTREYVERKNGEEETRSIEADQVDNLVTKALGVLQENGVYAAFLYLCSRTRTIDKEIAKKVRKELLQLVPKLLTMQSEPNSDSSDPQRELGFLTESVCSDLDKLLLVKQVWEQTLIYARYGAKARSVKEEADRAKKAKEEAEKAKSQP